MKWLKQLFCFHNWNCTISAGQYKTFKEIRCHCRKCEKETGL